MNRKKQLTYRISEWGFEKNVKKDERRELIQKLGHELQNPDYSPQNLRGRTIDKGKLNRWMRQENMEGETSLVDVNEIPSKHISVAKPDLFCVSISLTCYPKRQTKPQKSQRLRNCQATRI
jgi:hypothetical protein